MKNVRTRFAPSPTGFMHVGNLRSALYAFLFAKQNNGKLILRIENTDTERVVPGAVEVIYNTCKAANITFDEGPNEGGDFGPYVQSERKEIYHKYAQELISKGHAYYCFCDKERLSNVSFMGTHRYDKHCLSLSKEEISANLAKGIPYAIRQNIPVEGISEFEDLVFGKITIPNRELEDNVLLKSDGMPTYNFANVVDDHLMGITHVIRGNEYLSSTPKYNFLYENFGWERPEYIHLTPIMKDETRKLSKRHGDANFDDFINKGYLAEAVVNYIALLGWSPKDNQEKFTMEELISNFSVSGLSRSSSVFDEVKMRWLNGEYIKELSFADFMKYAKPYFDKSDIKDKYDYNKFGILLQSRIETFGDIPEKVNFIDNFEKFDNDLYYNKRFKVDSFKAKEIIEQSLILFTKVVNWSNENLHQVINDTAELLEIKAGSVYSVLRLAISSVQITPGGAVEIADILGKEETIQRLQKSLCWLND
ncbi:MAG TPA: glutamate--tRNA ligase [Acholeplasmataceae bacterium]|nr:glutamate--tRNA ligase [Acholeplasmataceae bacterium]